MPKVQNVSSKQQYSINSNIFKNYQDALFGLVVLICIPALSLFTVIFIDISNWSNYTFPILSICLAGAYDSFGRFSPKSEVNKRDANKKLICRVVFDVVAAVCSVVFMNNDNKILLLIPPILLSVCGLLIIKEVFIRIKTAIEISSWYTKLIERE